MFNIIAWHLFHKKKYNLVQRNARVRNKYKYLHTDSSCSVNELMKAKQNAYITYEC